jgi:hypothetical protein
MSTFSNAGSFELNIDHLAQQQTVIDKKQACD